MQQLEVKNLLWEYRVADDTRREEILHELARAAGAEQQHDGIVGHWTPSTPVGGAWCLFVHLLRQTDVGALETLNAVFPVATALCGDREANQQFAVIEWGLL